MRQKFFVIRLVFRYYSSDFLKVLNQGKLNLYRIMTICVGNICRSPLAEILFKHYLSDRADQFQISSAGISALVDHQAADYSILLAKENGLDLSHHRAKQLTADMIAHADLLLVMETRQQEKILECSPQSTGKIMLLGKWDKFEIPDPYRKPKQAFIDAYHLIDRGVNSWIEKL